MAPQCSSIDSTIEPKKGKIANWEMENESSNTFGTGDDGGNTTSTINMGSSFASLGDSSWANAELEDLFEVASPKKPSEENTRTTTIMDDEKLVVACTPDLMTPPPRQRSTLSLSQFDSEGLLKSSKSGRMSPISRSSAHNPLVSPRERKGLKKSRSERFTKLESKKLSRAGSLRDLKKDAAGKMSSSLRDVKGDVPSRRHPQGGGSDQDLKSLKMRRVKDSFEASDWLTSCYVDPFEKEVDKEPRRRARTIMMDPDSNDDKGNCHDGTSIPNRQNLSRSKATATGARASLVRTASMPSVQRAKEDPPGYSSSNSNYVWNNEEPTTPNGGSNRNSNSTMMRTLVRSTSSSTTEGNEENKDRRSRFGLSRAFQSFRQLPTGFISPTPSKKQSSLKSVLRGAVQVAEEQP